jgi:hypothetical protein
MSVLPFDPKYLSEDGKAWERLWNWKHQHRDECGNPFDENDKSHLVVRGERFDSFTEMTCECTGCGDTATFSLSDDAYEEWHRWQEAEFQALAIHYQRLRDEGEAPR